MQTTAFIALMTSTAFFSTIFFYFCICKAPGERCFELRQAKLRAYYHNSSVGLVLESINAIFSLGSCVNFIVGTYQSSNADVDSPQLFVMETIFTTFFIVNYFFQFYISRSRLRYFWSFMAVVDTITCIPVVITIFVSRSGGAGDLQFLRFYRFLKIVRVVRLGRLLRTTQFVTSPITDAVHSQIFGFVGRSICLVVFVAGAVQVVSSVTSDPWSDDNLICDELDCLSFHDALYFTFITISTVGYGDIAPDKYPGRLIMVAVVMCTIIYVPIETHKLNHFMSLRPQYGGRVPAHIAQDHVIICCDVTCRKIIEAFLQEFFHPDHGLHSQHVVLLVPEDPDMAWKSLILQYVTKERLTYLKGDLRCLQDLQRSRADQASAIFILTDRHAKDLEKQEIKTFLRALTCHEYNPDVKTFVQVFKTESIERFKGAGVAADNLLCLEAIRKRMLAGACLWQGLPTLLSNLISSCTLPDFQKMQNYEKDYASGLEKEIYSVDLTPFARNNMMAVTIALFDEFGCILFAVSRDDGNIFLYPGKEFIIEEEDEGLLIAEDCSVADEIARYGATKNFRGDMDWSKHSKKGGMTMMDLSSFQSGLSFGINDDNTKEPDEVDHRPTFSSRRTSGRAFSRQGSTARIEDAIRRSALNSIESENSTMTATTHPSLGRQNEKRSFRDLFMDAELSFRVLPNTSLASVSSHRRKSSSTVDEFAMIEIDELTPMGADVPLSEWPSSQEDADIAEAGAVVVITKTLDHLDSLFEYLFSDHIEHIWPSKEVILLCPALKNVAEAEDQIFKIIHNGDRAIKFVSLPPTPVCLKFAEVDSAKMVLILSSHTGNGSFSPSDIDAETIATYVEVRAIAKGARVIVELHDTNYMDQISILSQSQPITTPFTQGFPSSSQLCRNGSKRGSLTKVPVHRKKDIPDNTMFNHAYMSGDVVLGNFSELLLCQAYFNPHIIKVIYSLLSSTDEPSNGRTVFLAQVALPLNIFHQIAKEMGGGSKPNEPIRPPDRTPHFLPSLPEMETTVRFRDVFRYLLEKYDAVVLGIFRPADAVAHAPGHVITCPDKNFEISSTDKIFILAKVNVFEKDGKGQEDDDLKSEGSATGYPIIYGQKDLFMSRSRWQRMPSYTQSNLGEASSLPGYTSIRTADTEVPSSLKIVSEQINDLHTKVDDLQKGLDRKIEKINARIDTLHCDCRLQSSLRSPLPSIRPPKKGKSEL